METLMMHAANCSIIIKTRVHFPLLSPNLHLSSPSQLSCILSVLCYIPLMRQSCATGQHFFVAHTLKTKICRTTCSCSICADSMSQTLVSWVRRVENCNKPRCSCAFTPRQWTDANENIPGAGCHTPCLPLILAHSLALLTSLLLFAFCISLSHTRPTLLFASPILVFSILCWVWTHV